MVFTFSLKMASPATSSRQQIAKTCSFWVMFGSQFLDNGSTDSKRVYSFVNCDSRASFPLVQPIRHFDRNSTFSHQILLKYFAISANLAVTYQQCQWYIFGKNVWKKTIILKIVNCQKMSINLLHVLALLETHHPSQQLMDPVYQWSLIKSIQKQNINTKLHL